MSEITAPRIALIHALEESVLPIRKAFERHWPEAIRADLLDASLSADLAAEGKLNAAMTDRFITLGRYCASGTGAHDTRAILFTCSAFGPAIEAVKRDLSIPVMRPNEAAFAEALEIGPRIALVVTFRHSLGPLTTELEQMAAAVGKSVQITPVLAESALPALKAGDGVGHDDAVLRACTDIGAQDAVVLGQFSLARTAPLLKPRFDCPILTTPDSAVRALRRLILAS